MCGKKEKTPILYEYEAIVSPMKRRVFRFVVTQKRAENILILRVVEHVPLIFVRGYQRCVVVAATLSVDFSRSVYGERVSGRCYLCVAEKGTENTSPLRIVRPSLLQKSIDVERRREFRTSTAKLHEDRNHDFGIAHY